MENLAGNGKISYTRQEKEDQGAGLGLGASLRDGQSSSGGVNGFFHFPGI